VPFYLCGESGVSYERLCAHYAQSPLDRIMEQKSPRAAHKRDWRIEKARGQDHGGAARQLIKSLEPLDTYVACRKHVAGLSG